MWEAAASDGITQQGRRTVRGCLPQLPAGQLPPILPPIQAIVSRACATPLAPSHLIAELVHLLREASACIHDERPQILAARD